jgi:hypothetical protein
MDYSVNLNPSLADFKASDDGNPIRCAVLDGEAVLVGSGEAWMFIKGPGWSGESKGWQEINSSWAGMEARLISKADFDNWFPDLPPLPIPAFNSGALVYGVWDGDPVLRKRSESWVFKGPSWTTRGWEEVNSSWAAKESRWISKADFDSLFPNLPPLPTAAFHSGEKA